MRFKVKKIKEAVSGLKNKTYNFRFKK